MIYDVLWTSEQHPLGGPGLFSVTFSPVKIDVIVLMTIYEQKDFLAPTTSHFEEDLQEEKQNRLQFRCAWLQKFFEAPKSPNKHQGGERTQQLPKATTGNKHAETIHPPHFLKK